MEALRHPVARVRANPWLAVGIAAAALLTVGWLAWAIYVGSDRGVNEGLGVLIAVPAIVIALALVSLPFVGGYLLVKRLSGPSEGDEPAASDDGDAEPEESETAESQEDDEPAEEPEAKEAAS